MKRAERLMKILYSAHSSEKASILLEKSNTVIFKVLKNSTKLEILSAVEKLFEVEVKHVNTLMIKGKIKRHEKRIGRRRDWKKAYVTLKEGQNLDLVSGTE
ncbi:50S ribosomal protein L23 [Pantoea sp. Mhis]|uniref:50S ribosomal protein L23 n=1 Tax=Pantoea sp. Mhis TaxID=2576759 RepID=UPI00135A3FC7|nr:50S ribosomal protein L23 [Pantoea sp. Mhis]MXP56548.1 50S ribosomal protein L23 [Pantoea sp. Mhis]